MEKDISLSRVLYINPTCAVEVRSFPLGSIMENDTLSPIGCVARHTRIHSSVSHDKGMGISILLGCGMGEPEKFNYFCA